MKKKKKILWHICLLSIILLSLEVTMKKKKLNQTIVLLVAMHTEMHGICEKMEQRKKTSFFNSRVRDIMIGLTADANKSLKTDFLQFHNNFIGYVLRRYDFSYKNILFKVLFLNVKSIFKI